MNANSHRRISGDWRSPQTYPRPTHCQPCNFGSLTGPGRPCAAGLGAARAGWASDILRPPCRAPIPRCPPALTCPLSSTRCCAAGARARSSSARWSRPLAARAGFSMKVRLQRTACPASTTSRPGCSRTPSRGSRPCRAFTFRGGRGWDCHGLPVEVAVEKELGLTSKRDIEAYGITAFNARCRESVLRHVDAFAEFTERMGYWIDLSQAYRTMDPSYIESVWWSLRKIYDKGLLVRDFRISPYCPRCGTPLSDHEMGQPDVYRTVADPSVIVRFPLRTLPRRGAAAAGRRRPAGVDHDAVDAGLQHRRRRAPGRDLRDRPEIRRRRPGGRRRCAVRPRARRGLAHHRPVHRGRAGRSDLSSRRSA